MNNINIFIPSKQRSNELIKDHLKTWKNLRCKRAHMGLLGGEVVLKKHTTPKKEKHEKGSNTDLWNFYWLIKVVI